MTGQTSLQTADTRDAEGRTPRRVPRLIHVLCLIWAVFVIVENVQELLWDWPARTMFSGGTIGAHFKDTPNAGYLLIGTVSAGGPMARAGAVPGDKVKFDRPYEYARRMWPGEWVGLTLVHGKRVEHISVATEPRTVPEGTNLDWINVLYTIATAIGALFGLFIVWRSRRNATTWLLGTALLTYGLVTFMPELLVSGPDVFPLAYAAGSANLASISIFFYAFAISFYRDSVGPGKSYERIIFRGYVVLVVAYWTFTVASRLLVIRLIGEGGFAWPDIVILNFGYVACLLYLVQGWRRSSAIVQQRYALMLVATVAVVIAQAQDVVLDYAVGNWVDVEHLVVNTILTLAIAYPLFTYAILRHKVFDLSFAVNRTLVYSVVSAVLLASFGLVEWAVDHFAPVQGRGKSALIDAAIAVGIFLTFHRVRALVEHGVEGLFFRRWQEAEARLRRFVRESAFVRSPDVLARAFASALSRFAEDAPTAIYLTDGDGQPRKTAFSQDIGPEMLEVDDPVLVALRAEPKPVEPDHIGSHIAAALAVPMINRNEVVGVVLLGAKASGLSYRPDEIQLIDWATRQVGLDLYALKVEQLERERSELRVELRSANTQIERLLDLRGAQA